MDFGFTDTQEEIRSTAKSFLADRFKAEKVRELSEDGTYDDGLWSEVSELGWPGIAVAEEHGGQGLGLVELAILAEQIGYACAPLPFFSTTCAAVAIQTAGSDEQKAKWLPKLASGEALGTVAFGHPSGDGRVLTPDLEGADVVISLGPKGGSLTAGPVEGDPLDAIDRTRRYSMADQPAGEDLPGLHKGTPGARCAVVLAAEQVGIAQRTLEMATEYAKEREQFERPIGAYQAVSHKLADMLYDTEEARSLTYYAAWAGDAEPESLALAAMMAQARASDAAWSVSAGALQVHGGIGFTWEHDLHFWLKRAKLDRELFSQPGYLRDHIASAIGLRAA